MVSRGGALVAAVVLATTVMVSAGAAPIPLELQQIGTRAQAEVPGVLDAAQSVEAARENLEGESILDELAEIERLSAEEIHQQLDAEKRRGD